MPRATTHKLRALKRNYDWYATGLTWRVAGGSDIPGARGIFRSAERNEDIGGAKVEVNVEGISAQFIREELDALGISPKKGDILILDEPFDGELFFHVNDRPLSFNRAGLQILLDLRPAPDPDAPASPGYGFNPDD